MSDLRERWLEATPRPWKVILRATSRGLSARSGAVSRSAHAGARCTATSPLFPKDAALIVAAVNALRPARRG